jgi:hypothetical protein
MAANTECCSTLYVEDLSEPPQPLRSAYNQPPCALLPADDVTAVCSAVSAIPFVAHFVVCGVVAAKQVPALSVGSVRLPRNWTRADRQSGSARCACGQAAGQRADPTKWRTGIAVSELYSRSFDSITLRSHTDTIRTTVYGHFID